MQSVLPSHWMNSIRRLISGDPSPKSRSWGACYLIFPAPALKSTRSLSIPARWLIERARQLAEAAYGPVSLLTVDPEGRIRTLDGKSHRLRWLFRNREPILLTNLSFLLRLQPEFPRLQQTVSKNRLALLVSPDGKTLEAAGIPRYANRADLRRSLLELTSQTTPRVDPWKGDPVTFARQPGVDDADALASPLGPEYLNIAMRELLDALSDVAAINSPEDMRLALMARRDGSAVPWIFNTLISDIEFRTARSVLESYPPEVHLSLTGRCNIECRFCSYSHAQAYSDFVTPEHVRNLGFLRYAHTIRLSSGLGEPTVHPLLPEIIHDLSQAFPHLIINFFTNGFMLRRPGLIEAMVGRVAWFNVSLNASSRETWKALCQRDVFDEVKAGLRAVRQARKEKSALCPVIYASIVLTRHNIHELPRMPELCCSLGIERLTAIPFFSYAFDRLGGPDHYSAEDSFHTCRDRYDELFYETVEQARQHSVSIELPAPAEHRKSSFGLEVRTTYNFAGHCEPPYYWLPALLNGLPGISARRPACREIYMEAHIGSRQRSHADTGKPHHLYPCLGPMSMVDFSPYTGIDLAESLDFMQVWNHAVMSRLRAAQSRPGICRICDACRVMDSRDPVNFAVMENQISEEWPHTAHGRPER